MESDARQLSSPKRRCSRADGFLHDRMGLACTKDAVARVFRWRASVNAWRRAGHDAKNARVCPGASHRDHVGGMWVQRSAVRTRRRDADVHGHHGVIIRLRHVTPSRSARDRRSSSRITTKMPTLSQIPFVVSLSNHGRYRHRPPTSFDRFRVSGLRIDRDGNASVVVEAVHQQRRNTGCGERHAAVQTRSRQRRTLQRAPPARSPLRPAEPQRATAAARKEGATIDRTSRARLFASRADRQASVTQLFAPAPQLRTRRVMLFCPSMELRNCSADAFLLNSGAKTPAPRLYAPTPEQGRAMPKLFRSTSGKKDPTMAFRVLRKRLRKPPPQSRATTAQRKASGVAGTA